MCLVCVCTCTCAHMEKKSSHTHVHAYTYTFCIASSLPIPLLYFVRKIKHVTVKCTHRTFSNSNTSSLSVVRSQLYHTVIAEPLLSSTTMHALPTNPNISSHYIELHLPVRSTDSLHPPYPPAPYLAPPLASPAPRHLHLHQPHR